MSYYANGLGSISISGELGLDEREMMEQEYGDTLIFTGYTYDDITDETSIHLCYDGSYFEDDVLAFLDFIVEKYNVVDGCIEFNGEGGEKWRFKYHKDSGDFCEENSQISYLDISAERLLDILRAYVDNDLETADTDYVRDVLRDVCGMTDDELKATGFDYLFDEEGGDDE